MDDGERSVQERGDNAKSPDSANFPHLVCPQRQPSLSRLRCTVYGGVLVHKNFLRKTRLGPVLEANGDDKRQGAYCASSSNVSQQ